MQRQQLQQLQIQAPDPPDLSEPLDGRTTRGMISGVSRLALLVEQFDRLARESAALATNAAGLPDLARLTRPETIALADIVVQANRLRQVILAHRVTLTSAKEREHELLNALLGPSLEGTK